jgi:hypothetical protein
MNRNNFLIVYGVSLDQWKEKYGIVQLNSICSKCGKETSTTIPFVYGTWRGLLSSDCICGNNNVPYCFVNISDSENPFYCKPTKKNKIKCKVINFKRV